MGQRLPRADLVDHVSDQVLGCNVDAAAAEPGEVAIADLRADADTAVGRRLAGARQAGRVAGMEAARHVGAGDHVEHRLVVAQPPLPEALADVGVQINAGHT